MRRRRQCFDTVRMGVTSDVLNRLFSNDFAPLRAVRDAGLGLVDRVPRLKAFISQAGGAEAVALRRDLTAKRR